MPSSRGSIHDARYSATAWCRKIFELLVARHYRPTDFIDQMTKKCRAVRTSRELWIKPAAARSHNLCQHNQVKNTERPDDLETPEHDTATHGRARLRDAGIGFHGATEDRNSRSVHATRAGEA